MKYEHTFTVRVPLADVAEFHRQSGSLAAIGQVIYRREVTRIVQEKGRPVAVETKRGQTFPASLVIANLPPWNLARMLPNPPRRLRQLPSWPGPGWGAFVIYAGLDGAAAELVLPGTPVTFQRFTRRAAGWVAGFPQTGLFRTWPSRLGPGLWLVGDSIFPGQSTAAVALGGLRVAASVLAELGLKESTP